MRRHCHATFNLLLLLAAPLLACGDDERTTRTESDTSQADGGQDLEPSDANDTGEGGGCDALGTPGQQMPLLADQWSTQVHPDLAFDGQHVWLVANVADAEGGNTDLDIVGQRLDCAGEPVGEPFVVSADPATETDPGLAISADRALVVWNTDTAQAVNLETRYRVYDLSGDPVTDVLRYVPERQGEPVEVNAWLPDVAALPDGDGFAIAGSWGPPDATRFQAFAQVIDPDGQPAGDVLEPLAEPDVSQVFPAIGASSDGALHVAWTRTPDEGNERAAYLRLDPPDFDPGETQALEMTSTEVSADVAFGSAGDSLLFAFRIGAQDSLIALQTDQSLGGDELLETLDGTSRLDHSPQIALRPDGRAGALAWYQLVSGVRNDIVVSSLALDPAAPTIVAGDEVTLEGEALGVYAPAIIHLEDDLYLVATSQGSSPELTVLGEFVQLTPPTN